MFVVLRHPTDRRYHLHALGRTRTRIISPQLITMKYNELLDLYFNRSNALQWYWTVYVVVIGGLLAFSSLRREPHLMTAVLVSVLYAMFAYKNLGAIRDVTMERYAILAALKDYPVQPSSDAEMA